MPDVLPRTKLSTDGDRLVLDLPADLGDLSGERLVKRLVQLAKVCGLKDAVIRVAG